MTKIVVLIGAATLVAAAALAQHSNMGSGDHPLMHSHHPTGEADGVPGTISGYVRDLACLERNPKAGAAKTAVTKDCLDKCIRGGSPIGILTEDGSVYIPISDVIPDTDARRQMLSYTGKYIKASGRLFERGGVHAISIEKIEVISRPQDSKIPEL
jgi:hypothetical protein